MSEARYAIYAAPPAEDPLWRFGSALLGFDATTGEEPGPPAPLLRLAPDWPALAAEPRRYGFHGTLKAPFRLAPGRTEEALLAAARRVAAELAPVTVERLEPATLGRFLALVPAAPSPALRRLADACVRAFEPFRAPLTEAERERRLRAGLSERQARLLDLWGYPYVEEEFRFHMTLSGPLPDGRREPLRAEIARLHAAVPPGLKVADLAIFRQAGPAERFRILARAPLGG